MHEQVYIISIGGEMSYPRGEMSWGGIFREEGKCTYTVKGVIPNVEHYSSNVKT